MILATVLAVVFVVPAIAFLFRLDQRGLLPEEGVDDEPDESTPRNLADFGR
jgi:cytochrome d ubiquinol oxidase subunit II